LGKGKGPSQTPKFLSPCTPNLLGSAKIRLHLSPNIKSAAKGREDSRPCRGCAATYYSLFPRGASTCAAHASVHPTTCRRRIKVFEGAGTFFKKFPHLHIILPLSAQPLRLTAFGTSPYTGEAKSVVPKGIFFSKKFPRAIGQSARLYVTAQKKSGGYALSPAVYFVFPEPPQSTEALRMQPAPAALPQKKNLKVKFKVEESLNKICADSGRSPALLLVCVGLRPSDAVRFGLFWLYQTAVTDLCTAQTGSICHVIRGKRGRSAHRTHLLSVFAGTTGLSSRFVRPFDVRFREGGRLVSFHPLYVIRHPFPTVCQCAISARLLSCFPLHL